MSHAIFPGSFDPFTLGHANIVRRAYHSFDKLTILVQVNSKKTPVFKRSARVKAIQVRYKAFPGIDVDYTDSLTTSYMKHRDINTIVRGVRSIEDYQYELKIDAANRFLLEDCNTFLIPCSSEYSHLSSSLVRELWLLGGDVRRMVDREIKEMMDDRKSVYS